MKKKPRASLIVCAALALSGVWLASDALAQIDEPSGNAAAGGAGEQKPLLTPTQRHVIYNAASRDKTKVSPKPFPPEVGASVPPMIELYTLPDDATAQVPAVTVYRYTMVENKVVVVDPTRMRVVEVIGPTGP